MECDMRGTMIHKGERIDYYILGGEYALHFENGKKYVGDGIFRSVDSHNLLKEWVIDNGGEITEYDKI